jgi:hypothetical protein
MQQFAQENARMEMTQEMMGDTVDAALDDETTEDDANELVGQVGALLSWQWVAGMCVGGGGRQGSMWACRDGSKGGGTGRVPSGMTGAVWRVQQWTRDSWGES